MMTVHLHPEDTDQILTAGTYVRDTDWGHRSAIYLVRYLQGRRVERRPVWIGLNQHFHPDHASYAALTYLHLYRAA